VEAWRRIDLLMTMDASSGDGPLGLVRDAAVVRDGDRIVYVGPDAGAPAAAIERDASGCVALPGLVDPHTHSVWAGSRSAEFRERLAGATYAEILERGGGILSTVAATRAASEEALTAWAAHRLARMANRGVAVVEVKSGYGLTPGDEARMLRVAVAAGARAGVLVVPTFLGAHTIPAEHRARRDSYVAQIIEEQLPAVVGVAQFVDAYVDRGAFTLEEGVAVLAAGRALGLGVRVHAEQVGYTGIAEAAARLGARSADHLERLDAAGAAAMGEAGTIAVLLPGAMLYLHDTAPPIHLLRAHGVRMAVGTDLNPGSSPVDDLWTCATLACVTMGLTVEEALLGITAVAADSLNLPEHGRLRVGGVASALLVRPPPGEPADPGVLIQHLGGPEVVARWAAPTGRRAAISA
jgi:imidazolonepropionase